MPKKRSLKGGKKKGKVRKAILSIAIAVLFLLFIAYAIETFYPSPKWEKYCTSEYREYYNQATCEEGGGKWTAYGSETSPKQIYPGTNTTITGWCDPMYTCNIEFQKVNDVYNRNLFFVSFILGIITVIIAVLLSLESVSAGFMAGGVLLIVYGTVRYWGSLSNYIRTLMLAIALGILVWIGYKKLK